MSSFHGQFSPDPDPEMADFTRVWVTDKPLLRDALVTCSPPWPEYVTWERDEPSCDPSCPSGREASDTIVVSMHNNKNGFGDYQERAWEYILKNSVEIEVALRRKLFVMHRKNLKQFLEEDLPALEEAKDYWSTIKDQIYWDDSSAIDRMFKLVGIGLVDDGLDECGFTSFEFQTGWDLDHGASILMHKANTLISGGMTEFCGYSGSSLVSTIKSVQAYDLDEGDLSLLES